MSKIYITRVGTRALAYPLLAHGGKDLRRHWQLLLLPGWAKNGLADISTIYRDNK